MVFWPLTYKQGQDNIIMEFPGDILNRIRWTVLNATSEGCPSTSELKSYIYFREVYCFKKTFQFFQGFYNIRQRFFKNI